MHLRVADVVPLLALALLGATGSPTLKVHDAWVRPTPPGAPTAAVYGTIENTGAVADRLLAVETTAAETAELHSMSTEGGMMQMRKVEGGLPVPAKGSLQFRPGGYHIMLVRPKTTITAGDTVQVTFVFEQAGRVTLAVEAKDGSGPMAGPGAGHGSGHGSPKH